jgi:hypothetical protein
MPKIDDNENDILNAYEKGQLKSVATKSEHAKLKAAAHATALGGRHTVPKALGGAMLGLIVGVSLLL